MRSLARLLLAAAFAALPLGLVALSCGTDAVAVDACRQIETARCKLAPACGMPSFDVAGCTRFYRDECLVGIANASDGGGSTDPAACITALQGCAAGDASTAPGCPGQALHPGAKCLNGLVEIPSPTACDIVLHCPEVLEACHFVAAVPVTSVDGGAGDGGDGGGIDDGGDGGDAAGG